MAQEESRAWAGALRVRGARAPVEAAGRATSPTEAAQGGLGLSDLIYFPRLALQPFPKDCAEGWRLLSPGPHPAVAGTPRSHGRAGHKGHPAPLAEREGLSLHVPPRRATPAPWARSQLSSQPSTDQRGFNSSLPWGPLCPLCSSCPH